LPNIGHQPGGDPRSIALKLRRRQFLHLAASFAAASVLARPASAISYPTRPVHIIVGFPPGTAPDIIGRLTSEWLSERLGQQFIVDNRSGAASNIATAFVAGAAPDGYTLFVPVSTNAVNATLYKNLSFDFVRDIAPVASIGSIPFVMAVTPSLPVKTLTEFIAFTKANPGKVYMATQGIGTTPHVCGELLRMMTGIEFVHVPYRGPLMPDLLAGQVHFYFSPMPQAIGYVKDGRLRALAVTSAARAEALPDVPAIGEFVPGYEASGWFGIGAPRATTAEIVETLNKEIGAGLLDAKFKPRLSALGVEPRVMTPAEFKDFIAADVEKWAKVIDFAGIKPE
jgi:tripartite-type tricarboxylate transporter receptor subunit TctC